MKILVFGINFYPEFTGIGKYSGELASYLAEKGHEVHVITSPPYYPEWHVKEGYSKWFYKKELWSGTIIFRCPIWVPKKKNGIARLLHLLSFTFSSIPISLYQIFWNPDFVFAVAPALSSAPIAKMVAVLSNSRSWLHLQDLELDTALGLGMINTKSRLSSLLYSIENGIFKKFDHISTISEAMKLKLVSKGISPGKISLLPNWVDTDLIKPLSISNSRKELGLSEDAFIVLYAGNMGKKQGLEILLEASKILVSQKQILFILSGDGAERSQLEFNAQELPNIVFLPLQPVEKLNELLNLADIHLLIQKENASDLVMPSKLSGILASGKPVIATANQDTEIAKVVDPLGLVIPPEDPELLAKSIILLYNNGDQRIDFGKKGRLWVEKNWSRDLVLEQFNHELECF